MRRITPPLRVLTAVLCTYEAAAIVTRRFPTLSEVRRTHSWLAPTLVIALAIHLWWPVTEAP